jgi:hypothetical protein
MPRKIAGSEMITIELLIVAIITPRVVLERTTQRYDGCSRLNAANLLAISEVYSRPWPTPPS